MEVKSGQMRVCLFAAACVYSHLSSCLCSHLQFPCVCVRLGLFVWVRDLSGAWSKCDPNCCVSFPRITESRALSFISHHWCGALILSDGPESRYGFIGHHGSLSLLRLTQLNTVNNWSNGETEAGPHGMRMTSWVKARGNGYGCERRLRLLCLCSVIDVLSSKNTIHTTCDCLTRTVNRLNLDDKMSSLQKWKNPGLSLEPRIKNLRI